MKHPTSHRLELAKQLAAKAHEGHTRKNGKPVFSEHLQKVAMLAYLLFGNNLTEQQTEVLLICCYLHDAIEDSTGSFREWLIAEINEKFPDCFPIIWRLTHADGVPYDGVYINGIAVDSIARKVKIADILNNANDGATLRKKRIYRDALNALWIHELELT